MEFDLLKNKKKIIKNGIEIIDLLSSAIQYTNTNFTIIEGFYVGEDLEMRADLLSQVVYGNNLNWDILLKFNGISNPFALSKEDFILVPELGWIEAQLFDANSNPTEADIRNQYLDSNKMTSVDKKKLEYDALLKQLYNVNRTASFNQVPLPPNLAQPGGSEISVSNNTIILGN